MADTPRDRESLPDAPVNLRAERRRRGQSLDQAAEESGVTKRVLQNAELGGVPRPENQEKIASYYGLDLLVQWPEPDRAVAA